ncbi:hypothetical protein STEG23_002322, partial [Scotinomys teguina]
MIMVHLLIEFLFSLTGLLELCLVFGCALDLCICFYESLEKSSVMLRTQKVIPIFFESVEICFVIESVISLLSFSPVDLAIGWNVLSNAFFRAGIVGLAVVTFWRSHTAFYVA